MRKLLIPILLIVTAMVSPAMAYRSLQEVFENAMPGYGYDRYIELDPEIEYEGDLQINANESICIKGNGALVYGRPYMMSVYVVFAQLDISDCVLVDGGFGIYYGLDSYGTISNNTIINASEQGIATVNFDEDRGLVIYNNIITGSNYGFLCVEEHHPSYLGYNTVWNTGTYRYAEQCLD